jgi:hypothetical protein
VPVVFQCGGLRTIAASVVSVPASSLDQDWTNRSTAAGVIKATRFINQSDVDNWRWVNGTGAVPSPSPGDAGERVAWVQNSGVIPGTPCLRIEDDTTGNNQVTWAWNFDPAITSVNTTTSYIIAPGTTFYVQAFVKFNQTRWNNRAGSGQKIIDIGSANINNTNQVVQFAPSFGNNYPEIEGATTASPAWGNISLSGGTDFDLMPGYPSGAPGTSSSPGTCLYSTRPTGCLTISADIWYSVRFTINGGTAGGTNTLVKAEIKAQEDSSYTTFFYRNDLNIASPYQGGNGYSGLNLHNRDENHGAGGIPVGCYIYFDQIIVSLQLPAVPMATSEPTYFTNETTGRWAAVPGTTAGTILAAKGASASGMCAFSGAQVVGRKFYAVGMGGHADYGGNDCYSLDLSANSTTAWTSLIADSSPSGGNEGFNAVGDWSDGSRRADHTYNIGVGTTNGAIYFPAFGAMASSLGYPSTAAWKWRESQISNGRHGFDYLGKAFAIDPLAGGSLATVYSGSASAYDPRTRLVWYTNLYGWSTSPDAIWSIATDTDTITTYDGHGEFAAVGVWAAFIPEFNAFVVGTNSGSVHYMDVTTHSWSSATVTGSPPTDYTAGYAVHYYQAGHQLISWPLSGTSITVCDLPYSPTGTWAFRTKTAVGGGSTPDAPFSTPHNRLNIVQDMGNGSGAIVYLPDNGAPVYFWKLPRGSIP